LRRWDTPEIVLLSDLGQYVKCTRLFCIFEKGIFETIDKMRRW